MTGISSFRSLLILPINQLEMDKSLIDFELNNIIQLIHQLTSSMDQQSTNSKVNIDVEDMRIVDEGGNYLHVIDVAA